MEHLNSSPMPGVTVTPLRRMPNPKGDIYHAVKSGEPGFGEFGEAYFSTVHAGTTKGWKLHKRMVMNLIVPVGDVTFYLRDDAGNTASVTLGSHHYARLSVGPNIWMAFSGLSQPLNLVLNVASIPHDPEEAINVPLDTYPIKESAQ